MILSTTNQLWTIQWTFCKVNSFDWVAFGIISTVRNEIPEFYEGLKHLKRNLDYTSKIEGRYNTHIHSTHGSMTLTAFVISRLPWQRFVEWLKLNMTFNVRGLSNCWNHIWVSMAEICQIAEINRYDLCREYIWLYRDIM